MPNAEAAVLELDQAAAPGVSVQAAAPRFRINFAWTLAANIIYAGCQWMMLMAMAKVCAPAEVGVFALGLAVTAPVLMLANLQLRSVQATDARGSFRFQDYFLLRLLTTGLSLAVIALLAVMPAHPAGAAAVIAIIGLSKCFEATSDVLQGHLQQHEQMMSIAKSTMLKGVVSIIMLCAAIRISHTAFAAACGICAGSALTLAIYDWPVTSRFRAVFRTREPNRESGLGRRLLSLAWLALPLGVVQGMVSLSANIPRYYLEHFAGPRDLGIYSALASLIVAGQTVVSALGNVASPRLARSFAAEKWHEYRRLLWGMVTVGLGLGVCGVGVAAVFGKFLLKLLFRPEYAAHNDVLILLMAGGAVAYLAWFAGFGITAAREFRGQIPLLAATCLAAWGASAWLIPSHGIRGAAMALIVSMGVQLIGAAVILFRIGRRARGVQHAR
jgi:O-antigen/teichoic acid export membrane protein